MRAASVLWMHGRLRTGPRLRPPVRSKGALMFVSNRGAVYCLEHAPVSARELTSEELASLSDTDDGAECMHWMCASARQRGKNAEKSEA